MGLVLVTPPAVEPLTASEARALLNISEQDAPDTVMDLWLKAARQTLDGRDGWLDRALITQTWKLVLPAFGDTGCSEDYCWPSVCNSSNAIRLPLPPTQSVSSVVYYNSSGTETTMDSVDYRTFSDGIYTYVQPVGSNWPTSYDRPDSVAITFITGYGDSGASVPAPIRYAIALQASHQRSLSRNLFISEETVDGVGSRSFVVSENSGKAVSLAVQNLLSTYRPGGIF